MKDVLYVIAVMLGWPIAAALIAVVVSGARAVIFIPLWIALIIAGWIYTLPRQPQ